MQLLIITTYYNNDYTEEAAIGTGVTRQLKAERDELYVGDYFYTEEDDDEEEDDEEVENEEAENDE